MGHSAGGSHTRQVSTSGRQGPAPAEADAFIRAGVTLRKGNIPRGRRPRWSRAEHPSPRSDVPLVPRVKRGGGQLDVKMYSSDVPGKLPVR